MAYGLYHSLFDQMDANHDGIIDGNEIRNFVTFQIADRNHDGRVNLQEFAQSAAPQLGIRPQQARAAFHAADTNKDGVLSRQELNRFADLHHDRRADPYGMQQYRRNGWIGLGFSPQHIPVKNTYSTYNYSYNSSYTSHGQ